MLKRMHACTEGSESCRLCFAEKLCINGFPEHNRMLNK